MAFAFWRRYAQRVLGLALLDTRAEPDSPQARANREASIEKVRRSGTEALAREMLPALLAPSSFDDATLTGRALAIMSVQPVDGIVGALQGMRDREDSRPTLSTIDVKVLVVAGEADRLTPPADGKAMAAAIHGARTVVVPRAGHLSPWEARRGKRRPAWLYR